MTSQLRHTTVRLATLTVTGGPPELAWEERPGYAISAAPGLGTYRRGQSWWLVHLPSGIVLSRSWERQRDAVAHAARLATLTCWDRPARDLLAEVDPCRSSGHRPGDCPACDGLGWTRLPAPRPVPVCPRCGPDPCPALSSGTWRCPRCRGDLGGWVA